MTINYITGWPVAQAMALVIEEEIIKFIYKEIFLYYNTLVELLSDNRVNLLMPAV